MKRFISLIFAASLLAACEGEIPFEPGNADDMLILNGMIDSSQELHDIHVAISTQTSTRQVKSATMRCLVNGKEVARSTHLINEEVRYYGQSTDSRMVFAATFSPGDIVRIEVEADGKYSAWCEQTVPEPPVIEKADTVRLMHKGSRYGSPQESFRFDVTVNDDGKSINYYRICIFKRSEAAFYDENGTLIGNSTDEFQCNMMTDNDLILNDGHVESESGDIDFEMGVTNEFGIFSNARFEGGNATLHPFVHCEDFTGVSSWMEGAYWATGHNKAIVKVYSLEQRYYYYFKALNTLRNGSDDLALEDVSIPDNVEGGIGFVGIATPAEASFDMGRFYQDFGYY